jgi:hypothetical protein
MHYYYYDGTSWFKQLCFPSTVSTFNCIKGLVGLV